MVCCKNKKSQNFMKQLFNVLIVGAGNIGAFFDTPQSSQMLTHAHAFSSHPGFNLLGFVDCSLEKARLAAQVWQCSWFTTIEEAFAQHRVDVVCVATPDETHYEILTLLAQFSVKLVFAEKPLTKTLDEAEVIVALYQTKHIP